MNISGTFLLFFAFTVSALEIRVGTKIVSNVYSADEGMVSKSVSWPVEVLFMEGQYFGLGVNYTNDWFEEHTGEFTELSFESYEFGLIGSTIYQNKDVVLKLDVGWNYHLLYGTRTTFGITYLSDNKRAPGEPPILEFESSLVFSNFSVLYPSKWFDLGVSFSWKEYFFEGKTARTPPSNPGLLNRAFGVGLVVEKRFRFLRDG